MRLGLMMIKSLMGWSTTVVPLVIVRLRNVWTSVEWLGMKKLVQVQERDKEEMKITLRLMIRRWLAGEKRNVMCLVCLNLSLRNLEVITIINIITKTYNKMIYH
ncbi:BnaCnng47080D [Brassica napus]|uniref:BnaCnng47080D protein n=2 Tax=Brassica TaxID=3705 RepID=A0A078JG24_BRANA|nr:BnaCnng47080D [Brassica napus]VDD48822.1 unnamed protein product [Brassica oleracea]